MNLKIGAPMRHQRIEKLWVSHGRGKQVFCSRRLTTKCALKRLDFGGVGLQNLTIGVNEARTQLQSKHIRYSTILCTPWTSATGRVWKGSKPNPLNVPSSVSPDLGHLPLVSRYVIKLQGQKWSQWGAHSLRWDVREVSAGEDFFARPSFLLNLFSLDA
jgi:hypothetical protein